LNSELKLIYCIYCVNRAANVPATIATMANNVRQGRVLGADFKGSVDYRQHRGN
jgi:hypothetical protein